MSIIRQLDQLADRAANNEKNNRADFKCNIKLILFDFRRIYNSFLQSEQINTSLKRTFLRILTFNILIISDKVYELIF